MLFKVVVFLFLPLFFIRLKNFRKEDKSNVRRQSQMVQ